MLVELNVNAEFVHLDAANMISANNNNTLFSHVFPMHMVLKLHFFGVSNGL